jgi:ligand-binding sensor domain-containing protein
MTAKFAACGLLAVLVLLSSGVVSRAAPSMSLADTYVVDQWQTDGGLPQNSVTAIAQTLDGYLWLGTFNGLVRFDGARFVVFDTATTPELPSSRITGLQVDRRGRLWILSEFADLTQFDGGRFTSLRGRLGRVFHLVEDSQGEIWLHREAALERFDDGARIPLAEKDGTDFGWIRGVVCDTSGTFWALRKSGIGFSRADQSVFSPGLPAGNETPEWVAPGRDGGIWVALKSSGVAKFHDGRVVLPAEALPVPAASIKSLFEDQRGNLWAGTFAHGLMFRGTNGHWEVFSRTNGLSYDSIRVVHDDLEGNI